MKALISTLPAETQEDANDAANLLFVNALAATNNRPDITIGLSEAGVAMLLPTQQLAGTARAVVKFQPIAEEMQEAS